MCNGLKALERIESAFSLNKRGARNVYTEYTQSTIPYYEDYDLVYKQLKALDIIKTKRVDVDYFLAIVRKYDDKFMDLYNQTNTVFAYLTQEEYFILKEVLYDE